MEQIRGYFNAEKYESILFVLVEIIAFIFAVYFLFFQKESFYKGMTYPLIAVTLLQLIVGGSVWIKSPRDIERVQQFNKSSPENIEKVELPRMQVVMKNFITYLYVEITLLIFGLLAMFYFGNNVFLKSIGIGLFIQSALMLSLDFFAERGGGFEYLDFLLETNKNSG